MTIRKLTAEDRARAQALWLHIFRDSPAFTAYYFDNRFFPEHSFGAFDGEDLVAMVLGRPTRIFVNGAFFDALLISGVSTLLRYRRKGLMRRLMTLLLDHAKDSGFACCYLHPVEESIYHSLGFQNGTDARIIRSDTARAHNAFELREGTAWDDLLTVYQAVLLTHDGMQQRDAEEFRTVFSDYATENARTLIAYAKHEPDGYIVFNGEGDVSELLALRPSAYAFLLDEAAKRAGQELTAAVPADCELSGERVYSMQYLVFDDAFSLPLKNGFCQVPY